jgi:hypothetical protein
MLEILNGHGAAFHDVTEGLGLAARKSVLVDDRIPADGLLTALLDLGKLRGQPLDEVLQPSAVMFMPRSRTLWMAR